jgi:hypothetical protein
MVFEPVDPVFEPETMSLIRVYLHWRAFFMETSAFIGGQVTFTYGIMSR